MRGAIEAHSGLLATWKKGSQEELGGRVIEVSAKLPGLYREYKERSRVGSAGEGGWRERSEEVREAIRGLNERARV